MKTKRYSKKMQLCRLAHCLKRNCKSDDVYNCHFAQNFNQFGKLTSIISLTSFATNINFKIRAIQNALQYCIVLCRGSMQVK